MIRSWRAPNGAVLEAAEGLAEMLLFRAPEEVDLTYAAARLSAVIVSAPMSRGEGSTTRSAAGAVVSIDERLAGTPRARFVVAHELGHVALHPDIGMSAWCRGISGRYFQREIDACDFASRLLVPSELLARAVAAREAVTLRDARALARRFDVSLPVMLQRLMDTTHAPRAAVFSRAGVIAWWAASDAFPFRLTMGFELGREAHARAEEALAFHQAHGEAELVRAEAWSKDRRARGALVTEHSVRSNPFESGVLTLLSAEGDQDTLASRDGSHKTANPRQEPGDPTHPGVTREHEAH